MTLPAGRTALLVLDFQVGIADQPYAGDALAAALDAVDQARTAGLLVIYSKVAFRPGYIDVAPWSTAFGPSAANDLLPPGASRLVEQLDPRPGEIVVDKDRFSPFAASGLETVLRSQRVEHVVVAGVSTSGVALATFTHAENHDLPITLLSDACADPDEDLHAMLFANLFPRSATITTVADWRPA